MDNLFPPHPATENRIAALNELARSGTASGRTAGGGLEAAGAAPGPWSRAGARGRRGPWG
jgi:heat shock protein HtpX